MPMPIAQSFRGLLILLAVFTSSVPAGAQTAHSVLRKLYTEKRYFELRDQLPEYRDDTSPALLFYRGAVENVFNRPASAIAYLTDYLTKADPDTGAFFRLEAHKRLADSFRNSFRYREAAAAHERILDRFVRILNDEERFEHANELRLWRALADIPPQSVEFRGESRLRLDRSRIPLSINGHELALAYDTGADLSVLIRSRAERFGLRIIDVPIQVGTITGDRIEARVGVAEDLRMGGVILRHALFLVFEDEHFEIPGSRRQIEGVIGFPVLAALRELTFTREGGLLIPAVPGDGGEPNLALEGLKPLIEARSGGRRLTFVLDTGANRSDFWPPFYRAFAEEIRGRAVLDTVRFRGVGSRAEVDAYILPDAALRIAGRDVRFSRIPVFIEPTTTNSRYFFGNLGMDLVRQFPRMTINFVSMSVTFE